MKAVYMDAATTIVFDWSYPPPLPVGYFKLAVSLVIHCLLAVTVCALNYSLVCLSVYESECVTWSVNVCSTFGLVCTNICCIHASSSQFTLSI